MSRTTDPTPDDGDLLRAYLLERLAPDERDRLEERLLEDAELFELAEAVEGELTVDAVAGSLSETERESIERRLGRSPAGRSRLALARDLWKTTNGASVVPSASSWHPRAALVAAALAIALGAIVWTLHGHTPSGSIAVRRPAPVVIQAAPAPPRQAARAPVEATPIAGRAKVLAPPVAERQATSPLLVAVTILPALRGGEEETQRVSCRKGQAIDLEIEIDSPEELGTYGVTLRDAAGHEAKRLNDLEKQHVDDGRFILRLSAGQLAAGRYQLVVDGRNEGKEPEEIGSRDLEVIRH